jgi:glycosyltransferase involved in cell wall biosynthesis
MEETVLEDWRDHPSFVRFCRAVAAVARRSVRRAVMKRADLVFPVSDAMQAMLAETGERVEAMVPMPLGVAPTAMVTTQRRDQLRLELMIAPEQPMLIYVGTLNRLRHLDVLVRSLLHVRDSGIDAKLVFVGDGPRAADRECLEHSAQELGLAEHVRFLGRRPRQEVYDYIGSADLGLSYFPAIPLFRQNSPIKVMEYLGMGLPVVCTPQPEQQFVVEHCDGGIVAGSDSAQAFSEAIISALRRNWNAQEIRSKIQAIRGYDLLAAQFVQALEARLATQSAAR